MENDVINSFRSFTLDSGLEVKESENFPRITLFKNKGRAIDQERRWRERLAEVRSRNNRESKFMQNRHKPPDEDISINPWYSASDDTKYSWKFQGSGMMLAEWFLFKPAHFESDYFFKFYPIGRHVIFAASNGISRLYSRSGSLLLQGYSHMPGGSPSCEGSRKRYQKCVLDCVLLSNLPSISQSPRQMITTKTIEADKNREFSLITLHVLDIIEFRSSSFKDEPFSIRRDWLEKYFREEIERLPGENDPESMSAISKAMFFGSL
ncbi:unnamed protein product [Protopolystoma xenopodis]|uniref:Snurportin-1 n=1 Tax=Protopolystoma xenopodis TaxID=117903 RepID=A0A448WZP4_9PLAT|nr:unnamed protein product [Protopolystoma xenopodis]